MSAIFSPPSSGPHDRQEALAGAAVGSEPNGRRRSGEGDRSNRPSELGGPEDDDQGRSEPNKRPRASLANKIACVRCRQLKAKCVPSAEESGTDPTRCARCVRLSFDCEWVDPQKRGRKANSTNAISDEGPPAKQAPGPQQQTAAAAAAAADVRLDPLALLASAAPLPPLSAVAFTATAQPQSTYPLPPVDPSYLPPPQTNNLLQRPPARPSPSDTSPNSEGHRSFDASSSLRSETSPRSTLPSLSMMDLAQAKEKALQDLSAPGLMQPLQPKRVPTESRPEPDPIDMHVLSELDAQQLFDHYHRSMNAFIILLDPFLHKVDFVRRNSPVLFTTLLAVSAKFIRPALYASLIMHAKQLIGRAIIEGKVSLGLIQAMLLQVYWKEPEDSSAWLRVGEAIRMGYQLHLHQHRTTPLPDDEFEARLVMDRERTWIDLCAFDQTFFLQSGEEDDGFHQTCMIPRWRVDVQSWLRETKQFGVEDDLEQGADFEWIKMNRLSKDILKARPGNARALGDHVQGSLDAAYQQYLDPASPDAFAFETRAWIRVNFWLAAASLALARSMLTSIGTEADLLAKWVVASGTFVDAFEIIARHGYIQYWQDTLGITLYSMGEFSVKIFTKVYPATQRAIVGWMERIYRACELCTDGQAESTAAFISRFFQLCLRAVCSPTTTPESNSGPAHGGVGGAGAGARIASQYQPAQPTQPTYGLPDPLQPPLIGFHDASYWESIFPGLSTDWSWLDQGLEESLRAG